MGDRQLTNVLLAVIAAVLLFGSSAVTGALKWAFIIGAALLILYAMITVAAYLLRETVKSLQEAAAQGRDSLVMTVFGLAVMLFLPVFLGYFLLLWFNEVPKPLEVITDSWFGRAWLALLVCGGMAIGLSNLYTRRADIIPALRYCLSLLIQSPLAPIFLSIHGWRKARTAGDGVVSSSASAFVGFFLGLIFWAVVFGALAPFLGL
ncbi:hypothetical protein [Ensifer sp. Root127]|uniref:hypothetical protein n=1 Tax=Ensifer sp. Root127 TaxID=1736440 RepID=UPI00071072AA|nr:hypothetical protein [Ensifer sp. Root127]KQW77938.1 hypothetical protein ASD03_26785 [Ensifer sp. Root127]